MNPPRFNLILPDWLEELRSGFNRPLPTVEERMNFVIELSRLNFRNQTGGPFAAAVFRTQDGSLVAAGVNLVFWGGCSVLHAEIVALILAQQKSGAYDLSSAELPPCELVSSAEPCAMCMGAVPWSGVRGLVCGATGGDVEGIGFDEGKKPPQWAKALERRGVSVRQGVCREQAAAVLREYRESGGIIYNPLCHGNKHGMH